MGHPFSRSYGANLPSSLTRVISIALVFSTCPPVSVWGTGTSQLDRGFSRQYGFGDFPYMAGRLNALGYIAAKHLTQQHPTRLPAVYHRRGSLILLRPPFSQTLIGGTGI